ncbi:MAG: PAS domain S-box protein, partial [Flavobacterium sp.]
MNKQTVQNTPGKEFFNSDAFTQLFYRSPVPKCLISAQTKQIITVNKQYLHLTGFSEDDLLGVDSRTVGLVGFDEADSTLAAATEASHEVAVPLVISTKKDEKRSVLVYIYEFDLAHNEENYLLASLIDLTERERIAKLFRQEKEFKEKVIESINDGMSITDLSGTCIDVNPALIEMTGFKREELVGNKAPFKYWPPENHEEILSYFNRAREGQENNFHMNLMRKDGERFPALVVTSSIKAKDGRLIALLATIKDISEQVRVENMLRETAEKSNQRKKAILELASLVGSDYHESLKKITSLASRVLNVERVSVWKFNEDLNEIECEKLFNKTDNSFNKGTTLKKEDNPAYFESLSKNKTINVPDAINNNTTKAFSKHYLTPNKIASILDVFIQGQGDSYGIICFENVGSIREWTADEEEFATSVANLVSLMVQSKNRMIAEEKLKKLNVTLSNTVTELNELKNKLEHENVYLRNEIEMVFNFEEMVYGSEVFSKILNDVEQVAPTKANVLLLGETGTGKELLARAIHNLSDRKDYPLIKVNCAAIPHELIESELFGHKKGSFTGAIADKIGKVELANGGTLFLDEIGELP